MSVPATSVDPSPAITELGLLRQWVLWRYETRDDKRTKVPYAAPGRKAAVDNPQSWLSYDRATESTADFDGLGFVFTGTVYCGIDLDHCLDAASVIEPWARAIVQRFNSYTERSPSRRGLHIWIRGHLPGEQHRGRRRNGMGSGPGWWSSTVRGVTSPSPVTVCRNTRNHRSATVRAGALH